MTKDIADRNADGTLPADPVTESRPVTKPALRSVSKNDAAPSALAERALLASLLWGATYEPGGARASHICHLIEPRMFAEGAHPATFSAMLAVEAAGGTPEPVAVCSEAARAGARLDSAYLEALAAAATQPTEIKLRQWAEQIREGWEKRELESYAQNVARSCHNPTITATQAREAAHAALGKIDEGAVVGGAVVAAKEAATTMFNRLKDDSPVPVLPTGFRDIDGMLGGLFLEDVSLLAARTSVGKTALALRIARNIAKNSGHAAAYATLEMSAKMLVMRAASADASVVFKKVRAKQCDPAELQRIAGAINELEHDLYFIDAIAQTCTSIGSESMRLQHALAKRGKRLGLLVVDHVHLLKPEKNDRAHRAEQMAAVTRWMISISRTLRCHVLGIAQISRESERQGKDTRPMLHHIHEAGAFEQNVNNVFILHRKKGKSGRFSEDAPQLIVAKARNDATGTVRLGLVPQFMRFGDYEPPLADLPSRQYVQGAFPEEDDS